MFSWWINYFSHGFVAPIHQLPVEIFRYGLGVAILVKTVGGLLRGNWNRLDGRGLNWRSLSAPNRFILRVTYRPALILGVASGVLIVGPLPNVGAALAFAYLIHEQLFDARSHSKFQAVMCLFLAFMPTLASDPLKSILNASMVTVDNSWTVGLGMVMLLQLYWSSAFHKMRSPQFNTGALLSDLFIHRAKIQNSMVRFEFYIPEWVHVSLGPDGSLRRARIFRIAAVGTIATEILLPLLLLLGGPYTIVGIALGICMHLTFNIIIPVQLASFALTCWSAYALFLAPAIH